MTFTLKVTKQNVLGTPPSVDPANYFEPGQGLPAHSTADYYHMCGEYAFCPNLDLDACGTAGAAVKAANGGMRYPWLFSANHPSLSAQWQNSGDFMLGFSNDPGIFPTSLRSVITQANRFATPNHSGSSFKLYEEPYVIYNPDDVTGKPFWLYGEAGDDHWTALATSSDFVNWGKIEISHDHTASVGIWSSFQHIVGRPPNAWRSVGMYGSFPPHYGIWTSSNGIAWTAPSVAIAGTESTPHADGRVMQIGDIFTTGGTTYAIVREDARAVSGEGVMHVSICEINPTTFNILYPFVGTRFATYAGVFNGPTFLNDVRGYREDGVAHIYAAHGFATDVNSSAQQAGRPGASYANGGALVEEFIDYFAVIYDAAAAAQAAPCGVAASCNDGVVWINWDDALPANTYRLYRGSSAGSQTTLIKDVTGTFYPDNPTLGQMWWYKLVTLESGVERKSRVVHTYASSASNLINRHRTRLIDDGGA